MVDERFSRLLLRIASKLDERSRQPALQLQLHGAHCGVVSTPQQLQNALRYFHVFISDSEARALLAAFTNSKNVFDFVEFVKALYPPETMSFQQRTQALQQKEAAFSKTLTAPAERIESTEELVTQPMMPDEPTIVAQPQQTYAVNKTKSSSTPQRSRLAPTARQHYASTQPITKSWSQQQRLTYAASLRLTYNRSQQSLSSTSKASVRIPWGYYPVQEFKSHGKYYSTPEKPRFLMRPVQAKNNLADRS